MRLRHVRRIAPLAIAGGALVGALGATPAYAFVTGGCAGVGTIDGTTHDAAVLDPSKPISIPDEGDVTYQGSVPLPAGDTDRAYAGHVDLKLPLGQKIKVASWDGSSKEVAADGTHHYSIPSIVPRGVTVNASGSHSQDGLSAPCSGSFSIKLDGGPLDSPVPTAAAAIGTLGAGLALFRAGRARAGLK